MGSLVSDHTTVPVEPLAAECASAPKVTTDVLLEVLAVCAVEHAVPTVEVHV